MAYSFNQYELDPEPQSSPVRGGGPPRKRAGIGVLDPPFPPKRPHSPVPQTPTSLFFRIVAGVLVAVAIVIVALLFIKL